MTTCGRLTVGFVKVGKHPMPAAYASGEDGELTLCLELRLRDPRDGVGRCGVYSAVTFLSFSCWLLRVGIHGWK